MSRASEKFGGSEPYFTPYRPSEPVNDGYQSWEVLIRHDNENEQSQRRSLTHGDIVPWIHEVSIRMLVEGMPG